MGRNSFAVSTAALGTVLGLATLTAPASAGGSFLAGLHGIKTIASTVPTNGDLNPYGVAVVPRSVGRLRAGAVLISNFNDRANRQGTGSTIVQIGPGGARQLFAQIDGSRLPGRCPGGIGLTTALVALRSGWVVVGSLPTGNGAPATARRGCLLVLDSAGRVRETVAGGPINGPWDMTAADAGQRATLFVTNVLNGTVAAGGRVVNRGTVVRVELAGLSGTLPRVGAMTVIGSGFGERTDPAALVLGPTGVALGRDGTLYVADSVENRISALPNAMTRAGGGTGRDLSANGALMTPLGLALAPNGDVLTVNGGDGRIVEVTAAGAQVATRLLDTTGTPPGNGTLFGLAVTPGHDGVYFVDDATNTLKLLG